VFGEEEKEKKYFKPVVKIKDANPERVQLVFRSHIKKKRS